MLKSIIKIFIFLCVLTAALSCYAMTSDDLKQLPGFEMLGERIDKLIPNYGYPAAIVDHGIGKNEPKTKVQIGNRIIYATKSDWNIVYASKDSSLFKGLKRDKDSKFVWIPGAVFPGLFVGFDVVVFYTSGNQPHYIWNKKKKSSIAIIPTDPLKAHLIYQIRFTYPIKDHISFSDVTKKYGQPDEEITDNEFKPIKRYWISINGKEDYDITSYAVDFEMVESSSGVEEVSSLVISSDSMNFVSKKEMDLIDARVREHQNDKSDDANKTPTKIDPSNSPVDPTETPSENNSHN